MIVFVDPERAPRGRKDVIVWSSITQCVLYGETDEYNSTLRNTAYSSIYDYD